MPRPEGQIWNSNRFWSSSEIWKVIICSSTKWSLLIMFSLLSPHWNLFHWHIHRLQRTKYRIRQVTARPAICAALCFFTCTSFQIMFRQLRNHASCRGAAGRTLSAECCYSCIRKRALSRQLHPSWYRPSAFLTRRCQARVWVRPALTCSDGRMRTWLTSYPTSNTYWEGAYPLDDVYAACQHICRCVYVDASYVDGTVSTGL